MLPSNKPPSPAKYFMSNSPQNVTDGLSSSILAVNGSMASTSACLHPAIRQQMIFIRRSNRSYRMLELRLSFHPYTVQRISGLSFVHRHKFQLRRLMSPHSTAKSSEPHNVFTFGKVNKTSSVTIKSIEIAPYPYLYSPTARRTWKCPWGKYRHIFRHW